MFGRYVPNVFTVGEVLSGGSIGTLLSRVIGVHSLDVLDHDKDAAGEDEQQGHDAKNTDSIETKENIWKRDERIWRGRGRYAQVRMGAMSMS